MVSDHRQERADHHRGQDQEAENHPNQPAAPGAYQGVLRKDQPHLTQQPYPAQPEAQRILYPANQRYLEAIEEALQIED